MRLPSVLVSACLLAVTASAALVTRRSEPQVECLDAVNNTGTCGSIFDCPGLSPMVQNGTIVGAVDITYLKKSICGVKNGRILVCCVSRTSPDNHPNKRLLEEGKLCGTYVHQRIRGGTEVPLGKHPWMAVLFYKDINGYVKPGCGGTLISMQHVLTAAHCVITHPDDHVVLTSVRLGEHDLESEVDCQRRADDTFICNSPQNFDINATFVHEEYNFPNVRDNDIALLKLDRPVEEDHFVGKICLPFGIASHRDYTGVNMTVAGFGKSGPRRSSPSSNVLMDVVLPGMKQEDCRSIIEKNGGTIGEKQMCAGGERRRDSCAGDSGGPVIVATPTGPPYSLVGIVSFGATKCGEGGIPSVNTRVSEYLNWILDKLSLD